MAVVGLLLLLCLIPIVIEYKSNQCASGLLGRATGTSVWSIGTVFCN